MTPRRVFHKRGGYEGQEKQIWSRSVINVANYKNNGPKSVFLPFRSANLSILINQIGDPKDFESEAPNMLFSGGYEMTRMGESP